MKAIKTKFKGPTNTRGSRIIASDQDGNTITKTVSELEALARSKEQKLSMSGEELHQLAAEALRDKMKWTGELIGGSLKNGYVFVFKA